MTTLRSSSSTSSDETLFCRPLTHDKKVNIARSQHRLFLCCHFSTTANLPVHAGNLCPQPPSGQTPDCKAESISELQPPHAANAGKLHGLLKEQFVNFSILLLRAKHLWSCEVQAVTKNASIDRLKNTFISTVNCTIGF